MRSPQRKFMYLVEEKLGITNRDRRINRLPLLEVINVRNASNTGCLLLQTFDSVQSHAKLSYDFQLSGATLKLLMHDTRQNQTFRWTYFEEQHLAKAAVDRALEKFFAAAPVEAYEPRR